MLTVLIMLNLLMLFEEVMLIIMELAVRNQTYTFYENLD